MLSDLKLKTYTWIATFLAALTISIIFVTSFFIEKKINVINENWQLYQTDLNEKSRLESALRSSIGYGGMIHNFKNYVLRQNNVYLKQTESQLGAAYALLTKYKTLQITPAENAAIDDIQSVFLSYRKALQDISKQFSKGQSIFEVNRTIVINDNPAIRGLSVLRAANIANQKYSHKINKSRMLADIRASLGYDGFIHDFKDYLLNHKEIHKAELEDLMHQEEILNQAKSALNTIQKYRQFSLNASEELALNDIEFTINHYLEKFKSIEALFEQNKTLKEADRILKVDDSKALRGFQILDFEINREIANNSKKVSNALSTVKQSLTIGTWITMFTIFTVIFIIIIIIRLFIIRPTLKLTSDMRRLANNELDIEISGYDAQNEIGQMARAVVVFKANMIKLFDAEKQSSQINEQLRQNLKENEQLRSRAEEQTNRALLMAEHMENSLQISEKAMAQVEKDELYVSSILNAVRDGIVTINSKGVIENFNPGAEDIFGYKSYEVIGKNISLLMPEPHKSAHDGYLDRFEKGLSSRDQTIPLDQQALRKNGETFPVEVSLNTIRIGNETKITGVIRDITERKNSEERIEKLAMTDALTGLANRHQYDQRIHEAEQSAKRFNTPFALLLIDLDKFKPVNDTYGHQVGDILLQKVADSLLQACREVDMVCRIGGDEFAIIVKGTDKVEELAILAERINDQLSTPFTIENHSVQVGACIGISIYPNDSTDIEMLVQMADKALYRCKGHGSNSYQFSNKRSDSEKDLS